MFLNFPFPFHQFLHDNFYFVPFCILLFYYFVSSFLLNVFFIHAYRLITINLFSQVSSQFKLDLTYFLIYSFFSTIPSDLHKSPQNDPQLFYLAQLLHFLFPFLVSFIPGPVTIFTSIPHVEIVLARFSFRVGHLITLYF